MRNIVLDLVHTKAVCCGLNGHLCKSTKSTKVYRLRMHFVGRCSLINLLPVYNLPSEIFTFHVVVYYFVFCIYLPPFIHAL